MQLEVISWFLLTLFIGVFADKRLVIQDSLVCLVQDVTPHNKVKEVTLYVNGVENPTRIVTFTFLNGHISMEWDPHMADNYSKIFMDAKRNICIANIDETYERKFKIQSSTILEVELTILRNVTEKQIGQNRKFLDDHSEDIKGYLGHKFIVIIGLLIGLIILLTVLTIVLVFIFRNVTKKQIGQNRKLLDDHSEDIKGYLGNVTGEQMGQIKKLLNDHSKDFEKYLDSWRHKNYKDQLAELKINLKDSTKGDKAHTRSLDQSRKQMTEDTNSDDEEHPDLPLLE